MRAPSLVRGSEPLSRRRGPAPSSHPPASSAVDVQDEASAADDDYLEAVCKETLRLRPVIPIVVRMLKAPFELGDRGLFGRHVLHVTAEPLPEVPLPPACS